MIIIIIGNDNDDDDDISGDNSYCYNYKLLL